MLTVCAACFVEQALLESFLLLERRVRVVVVLGDDAVAIIIHQDDGLDRVHGGLQASE